MILTEEHLERIHRGENLVKVWRQAHRMSVVELAASAGLPPSQVRRMEGRSRLSEDEAEALGRAFRVDACEFQRWPGQFGSCGKALDGIDVDALEAELATEDAPDTSPPRRRPRATSKRGR